MSKDDSRKIVHKIGGDKVFRVGSKVIHLLEKRTRSTAEAYEVLRFLCIYFEETYGCKAVSPTDAELRELIKTLSSQ